VIARLLPNAAILVARLCGRGWRLHICDLEVSVFLRRRLCSIAWRFSRYGTRKFFRDVSESSSWRRRRGAEN